MKIELKNYIDSKTKVIIGKDLGHAIFTQIPIIEMIRLGETVEVVVPKRIIAISPSFLEAFLASIVDNGIQDKVKFKFLGINFQSLVDSAISHNLRRSEYLDKGYYYYCESFQGYFVCFADNIEKARASCILEYGHIKKVRRATFDEIEKYCKIKNIDSMWSWSRIVGGKNAKENNRRFQLKA